MRFAVCMNCDHCFADPMPSPENLRYFYESGIYSITQEIRGRKWKNWGYTESLEDYNLTFTNKIGLGKEYVSYFKKIVGNISLSGICLDYGCGVGGILKAFSEEYGLHPIGFELDERKAEIAQKNDIEILSESVITNDEWLKNNQNNVALIIATDFLEHLIDPVSFVKTLLNRFPKAILFFGVPGFGHLYIRNDYPLVGNVLNFPHIQRFSHQSICNTFKQVGYEISLYESDSMKYMMIVGFQEISLDLSINVSNERKEKPGKMYRRYYKRQFLVLFKVLLRTIFTVIFGRSDLRNLLKGKKPV